MDIKADIIFLGRRDHDDPLHRFYFDTLCAQLICRRFSVKLISPEEDLSSHISKNRPAAINFFYKDKDAIQSIKKVADGNFLSLAFCSDIDSYADYADAYRVADVFVCPSEMHQQVLRCVFDLPVYCLREALDPILESTHSVNLKKNSVDLVWFGFPESYQKSMVALEVAIISALQDESISSFSVISGDSLEGQLPPEFTFIRYETNTFAKKLRSFTFTILSHIPLDLHLNTFIKSPNKACSSIMSGMIPICSNTPNYCALLKKLGLENYLFDSPEGLLSVLRQLRDLSASADLQAQWNYASQYVSNHFSVQAQCDEYLEIIASLGDSNLIPGHAQKPSLKLYSTTVAPIKLRFYLRQQITKVRQIFGKSNA
jgi:hypothetical protein